METIETPTGKIYEHRFYGGNNVHVYRRKYLGSGKYYIRAIAKGIEVNDMFNFRDTLLRVEKIISVSNSKGTFADAEFHKNALVECEVVDDSFRNEDTYRYCKLGGI